VKRGKTENGKGPKDGKSEEEDKAAKRNRIIFCPIMRLRLAALSSSSLFPSLGPFPFSVLPRFTSRMMLRVRETEVRRGSAPILVVGKERMEGT
jgi:hypothetical protein